MGCVQTTRHQKLADNIVHCHNREKLESLIVLRNNLSAAPCSLVLLRVLVRTSGTSLRDTRCLSEVVSYLVGPPKEVVFVSF